MKSLANAVVYAVTYLNCTPSTGLDDEDIAALDSIRSQLERCTEEEKDALAEAANDAFDAERVGAHRMDFMQDYLRWMQDMFGKEEWQLNNRRRSKREKKTNKPIAPTET
jgi:DNA-binding GntR family transcriptional regulator